MLFLHFQEETYAMDYQVSDFIKSKKALVIEDDPAIAQLLKLNLVQLGFDVDVFHDAEKAEAQIKNINYILCLLDWMLPGAQGIDFLRKNRTQLGYTKIMMVTARADAESVVSGLDSGADDYLAKPFDAAVLAARVRHLMRRAQFELTLGQPKVEVQPELLGFDGLSIHLTKHIVTINNDEIHLTPSEFKLLAELLKAQGQVLTRDRLIDLIQGQDVTVTGRTIDTHIFTLRKKIGLWSRHIETIRGVGYRILISLQDSSEPESL
jgi:two-component system phosphate regulon response regulator PhoB